MGPCRSHLTGRRPCGGHANDECSVDTPGSKTASSHTTTGAKRRSYIPKAGSAKGRPLGISNFEDKIVEASVKRTLEPIYESVFEDSSYGYRPRRSQHQCLDELGRTIQQKRINYVAEADIKSFFDQVHHQWLIKFLRHRIGDERVIRLIIRMLKSGIMEDGLVKASELGTPQGSILSP